MKSGRLSDPKLEGTKKNKKEIREDSEEIYKKRGSRLISILFPFLTFIGLLFGMAGTSVAESPIKPNAPPTASILVAQANQQAQPPRPVNKFKFPKRAKDKRHDFIYYSYDYHVSAQDFRSRLPFLEAAWKDAKAGGAEKGKIWMESAVDLGSVDKNANGIYSLSLESPAFKRARLKEMNVTERDFNRYLRASIEWLKLRKLSYQDQQKTIMSNEFHNNLDALIEMVVAPVRKTPIETQGPFMSQLGQFKKKHGMGITYEKVTIKVTQLFFKIQYWRDMTDEAMLQGDFNEAMRLAEQKQALIEEWLEERSRNAKEQMQLLKRREPTTALFMIKGVNHTGEDIAHAGGEYRIIPGYIDRPYIPGPNWDLYQKSITGKEVSKEEREKLLAQSLVYDFLQMVLHVPGMPQGGTDHMVSQIIRGRHPDRNTRLRSEMTVDDVRSLFKTIKAKKSFRPTDIEVGNIVMGWLGQNKFLSDEMKRNGVKPKKNKTEIETPKEDDDSIFPFVGIGSILVAIALFFLFRHRNKKKATPETKKGPSGKKRKGKKLSSILLPFITSLGLLFGMAGASVAQSPIKPNAPPTTPVLIAEAGQPTWVILAGVLVLVLSLGLFYVFGSSGKIPEPSIKRKDWNQPSIETATDSDFFNAAHLVLWERMQEPNSNAAVRKDTRNSYKNLVSMRDSLKKRFSRQPTKEGVIRQIRALNLFAPYENEKFANLFKYEEQVVLAKMPDQYRNAEVGPNPSDERAGLRPMGVPYTWGSEITVANLKKDMSFQLPPRPEFQKIRRIKKDEIGQVRFFETVSLYGTRRFFRVDSQVPFSFVEVERESTSLGPDDASFEENPGLESSYTDQRLREIWKDLSSAEKAFEMNGAHRAHFQVKDLPPMATIDPAQTKKVEENIATAYNEMLPRSEEQLRLSDLQNINRMMNEGLLSPGLPLTLQEISQFRQRNTGEPFPVRQWEAGLLRGTKERLPPSVLSKLNLEIDGKPLADQNVYGDLIGVEQILAMPTGRRKVVIYTYPSAKVKQGMVNLVNNFNKLSKSSTLEDVARLKKDLIFIQPFAEANKRTARLLLDMALLKIGMPPLPFYFDLSYGVLNEDEYEIAHNMRRAYERYYSSRPTNVAKPTGGSFKSILLPFITALGLSFGAAGTSAAQAPVVPAAPVVPERPVLSQEKEDKKNEIQPEKQGLKPVSINPLLLIFSLIALSFAPGIAWRDLFSSGKDQTSVGESEESRRFKMALLELFNLIRAGETDFEHVNKKLDFFDISQIRSSLYFISHNAGGFEVYDWGAAKNLGFFLFVANEDLSLTMFFFLDDGKLTQADEMKLTTEEMNNYSGFLDDGKLIHKNGIKFTRKEMNKYPGLLKIRSVVAKDKTRQSIYSPKFGSMEITAEEFFHDLSLLVEEFADPESKRVEAFQRYFNLKYMNLRLPHLKKMFTEIENSGGNIVMGSETRFPGDTMEFDATSDGLRVSWVREGSYVNEAEYNFSSEERLLPIIMIKWLLNFRALVALEVYESEDLEEAVNAQLKDEFFRILANVASYFKNEKVQEAIEKLEDMEALFDGISREKIQRFFNDLSEQRGKMTFTEQGGDPNIFFDFKVVEGDKLEIVFGKGEASVAFVLEDLGPTMKKVRDILVNYKDPDAESDESDTNFEFGQKSNGIVETIVRLPYILWHELGHVVFMLPIINKNTKIRWDEVNPGTSYGALHGLVMGVAGYVFEGILFLTSAVLYFGVVLFQLELPSWLHVATPILFASGVVNLIFRVIEGGSEEDNKRIAEAWTALGTQKQLSGVFMAKKRKKKKTKSFNPKKPKPKKGMEAETPKKSTVYRLEKGGGVSKDNIKLNPLKQKVKEMRSSLNPNLSPLESLEEPINWPAPKGTLEQGLIYTIGARHVEEEEFRWIIRAIASSIEHAASRGADDVVFWFEAGLDLDLFYGEMMRMSEAGRQASGADTLVKETGLKEEEVKHLINFATKWLNLSLLEQLDVLDKEEADLALGYMAEYLNRWVASTDAAVNPFSEAFEELRQRHEISIVREIISKDSIRTMLKSELYQILRDGHLIGGNAEGFKEYQRKVEENEIKNMEVRLASKHKQFKELKKQKPKRAIVALVGSDHNFEDIQLAQEGYQPFAFHDKVPSLARDWLSTETYLRHILNQKNENLEEKLTLLSSLQIAVSGALWTDFPNYQTTVALARSIVMGYGIDNSHPIKNAGLQISDLPALAEHLKTKREAHPELLNIKSYQVPADWIGEEILDWMESNNRIPKETLEALSNKEETTRLLSKRRPYRLESFGPAGFRIGETQFFDERRIKELKEHMFKYLLSDGTVMEADREKFMSDPFESFMALADRGSAEQYLKRFTNEEEVSAKSIDFAVAFGQIAKAWSELDSVFLKAQKKMPSAENNFQSRLDRLNRLDNRDHKLLYMIPEEKDPFGLKLLSFILSDTFFGLSQDEKKNILFVVTDLDQAKASKNSHKPAAVLLEVAKKFNIPVVDPTKGLEVENWNVMQNILELVGKRANLDRSFVIAYEAYDTAITHFQMDPNKPNQNKIKDAVRYLFKSWEKSGVLSMPTAQEIATSVSSNFNNVSVSEVLEKLELYQKLKKETFNILAQQSFYKLQLENSGRDQVLVIDEREKFTLDLKLNYRFEARSNPRGYFPDSPASNGFSNEVVLPFLEGPLKDFIESFPYHLGDTPIEYLKEHPAIEQLQNLIAQAKKIYPAFDFNIDEWDQRGAGEFAFQLNIEINRQILVPSGFLVLNQRNEFIASRVNIESTGQLGADSYSVLEILEILNGNLSEAGFQYGPFAVFNEKGISSQIGEQYDTFYAPPDPNSSSGMKFVNEYLHSRNVPTREDYIQTFKPEVIQEEVNHVRDYILTKQLGLSPGSVYFRTAAYSYLVEQNSVLHMYTPYIGPQPSWMITELRSHAAFDLGRPLAVEKFLMGLLTLDRSIQMDMPIEHKERDIFRSAYIVSLIYDAKEKIQRTPEERFQKVLEIINNPPAISEIMKELESVSDDMDRTIQQFNAQMIKENLTSVEDMRRFIVNDWLLSPLPNGAKIEKTEQNLPLFRAEIDINFWIETAAQGERELRQVIKSAGLDLPKGYVDGVVELFKLQRLLTPENKSDSNEGPLTNSITLLVGLFINGNMSAKTKWALGMVGAVGESLYFVLNPFGFDVITQLAILAMYAAVHVVLAVALRMIYPDRAPPIWVSVLSHPLGFLPYVPYILPGYHVSGFVPFVLHIVFDALVLSFAKWRKVVFALLAGALLSIPGSSSVKIQKVEPAPAPVLPIEKIKEQPKQDKPKAKPLKFWEIGKDDGKKFPLEIVKLVSSGKWNAEHFVLAKKLIHSPDIAQQQKMEVMVMLEVQQGKDLLGIIKDKPKWELIDFYRLKQWSFDKNFNVKLKKEQRKVIVGQINLVVDALEKKEKWTREDARKAKAVYDTAFSIGELAIAGRKDDSFTANVYHWSVFYDAIDDLEKIIRNDPMTIGMYWSGVALMGRYRHKALTYGIVTEEDLKVIKRETSQYEKIDVRAGWKEKSQLGLEAEYLAKKNSWSTYDLERIPLLLKNPKVSEFSRETLSEIYRLRVGKKKLFSDVLPRLLSEKPVSLEDATKGISILANFSEDLTKKQIKAIQRQLEAKMVKIILKNKKKQLVTRQEVKFTKKLDTLPSLFEFLTLDNSLNMVPITVGWRDFYVNIDQLPKFLEPKKWTHFDFHQIKSLPRKFKKIALDNKLVSPDQMEKIEEKVNVFEKAMMTPENLKREIKRWEELKKAGKLEDKKDFQEIWKSELIRNEGNFYLLSEDGRLLHIVGARHESEGTKSAIFQMRDLMKENAKRSLLVVEEPIGWRSVKGGKYDSPHEANPLVEWAKKLKIPMAETPTPITESVIKAKIKAKPELKDEYLTAAFLFLHASLDQADLDYRNGVEDLFTHALVTLSRDIRIKPHEVAQAVLRNIQTKLKGKTAAQKNKIFNKFFIELIRESNRQARKIIQKHKAKGRDKVFVYMGGLHIGSYSEDYLPIPDDSLNLETMKRTLGLIERSGLKEKDFTEDKTKKRIKIFEDFRKGPKERLNPKDQRLDENPVSFKGVLPFNWAQYDLPTKKQAKLAKENGDKKNSSWVSFGATLLPFMLLLGLTIRQWPFGGSDDSNLKLRVYNVLKSFILGENGKNTSAKNVDKVLYEKIKDLSSVRILSLFTYSDKNNGVIGPDGLSQYVSFVVEDDGSIELVFIAADSGFVKTKFSSEQLESLPGLSELKNVFSKVKKVGEDKTLDFGFGNLSNHVLEIIFRLPYILWHELGHVVAILPIINKDTKIRWNEVSPGTSYGALHGLIIGVSGYVFEAILFLTSTVLYFGVLLSQFELPLWLYVATPIFFVSGVVNIIFRVIEGGSEDDNKRIAEAWVALGTHAHLTGSFAMAKKKKQDDVSPEKQAQPEDEILQWINSLSEAKDLRIDPAQEDNFEENILPIAAKLEKITEFDEDPELALLVSEMAEQIYLEKEKAPFSDAADFMARLNGTVEGVDETLWDKAAHIILSEDENQKKPDPKTEEKKQKKKKNKKKGDSGNTGLFSFVLLISSLFFGTNSASADLPHPSTIDVIKQTQEKLTDVAVAVRNQDPNALLNSASLNLNQFDQPLFETEEDLLRNAEDFINDPQFRTQLKEKLKNRFEANSISEDELDILVSVVLAQVSKQEIPVGENRLFVVSQVPTEKEDQRLKKVQLTSALIKVGLQNKNTILTSAEAAPFIANVVKTMTQYGLQTENVVIEVDGIRDGEKLLNQPVLEPAQLEAKYGAQSLIVVPANLLAANSLRHVMTWDALMPISMVSLKALIEVFKQASIAA